MSCDRPGVERVGSICENVQRISFFQVDLSVSCMSKELFLIATSLSKNHANIFRKRTTQTRQLLISDTDILNLQDYAILQ